MSTTRDRALFLLERQRFETAEMQLRQIIANEPDDGPAHALLAICLAELRRYDEATEAANRAVALEPEMAYCHWALGVVFTERHRYDEALAAAERAVALQPTEPDYFALLARVRMAREEWGEALAAAEAGLRQDAEHAGCANVRALALRQLGRGDEADALLDDALARDPENAFAHASRGWAMLEQGRQRPALDHFREALRLDPTFAWAKEGIVAALKARHAVYGVLLRAFLWMQRQSPRTRWLIVLGGVVGYRLLRRVADANPALAPVIWPVLVAYLAFVLLSWLADPLLDLTLRLNEYGRQALSRDRVVASNWVGLTILAALVLAGIALVSGAGGALVAALALGFVVIPVAGTFQCDPGWPRTAMAAYSALLAAAALAAAVAPDPLGGMLGVGAILGAVLGSWLARGLAGVTVRR